MGKEMIPETLTIPLLVRLPYTLSVAPLEIVNVLACTEEVVTTTGVADAGIITSTDEVGKPQVQLAEVAHDPLAGPIQVVEPVSTVAAIAVRVAVLHPLAVAST